jgi:hypothetical protein
VLIFCVLKEVLARIKYSTILVTILVPPVFFLNGQIPWIYLMLLKFWHVAKVSKIS